MPAVDSRVRGNNLKEEEVGSQENSEYRILAGDLGPLSGRRGEHASLGRKHENGIKSNEEIGS
jgi:hypothetical protein